MLTTLTLFCEGQRSWVHDVCQCKEPLVPLSSVDKHCLTKNSLRACGMGLGLMAPEPADLCSVSGTHRKIGENQSFTSCLWLPRVCPRGMHHQEINVKRNLKKKKRFLWKQMIKMTRAKLLNFYTKYFTVKSNAGGLTTAQLQYLGFLKLCPGTLCCLCFQRGGSQPSRSWIQRSCTKCFQNGGKK